jgi:hypothetical protein
MAGRLLNIEQMNKGCRMMKIRLRSSFGRRRRVGPQSRNTQRIAKDSLVKQEAFRLFSFQPVNLSTFQPYFPAAKSGHYRSNRPKTAKTDMVVLN